MRIQIVGLDSGNPTFGSVEEMLQAAPSLGLTHNGTEEAPHLVPELKGLPKFKELAGPMSDGGESGEPRIRYETWAAYEMLSR